MNNSTSSGFSAGAVIVPILTGVIGFAAGYLADSATKVLTNSPSEAQAATSTTYTPEGGDEQREGYPATEDDLDGNGIPDAEEFDENADDAADSADGEGDPASGAGDGETDGN